MKFWINGCENKQIDITDRSIAFGDGCFTTISCLKHEALMLNNHIERLKNDCKRLEIIPPNWRILTNHIKQICNLESDNKFILKIIISRGNGIYGYSSKLINKPNIIVIKSKFPIRYNNLQKKGAKLIVSNILLSRNKLLAGIKHLNRLEQVLIYKEIDNHKADEAVVLDTLGFIIECCSANIFWRINTTVYTPVLSHSGVNGVMKQRITSILINSNFNFKKVKKTINTLLECDEVIICNALMPILYVNYIESKKYKFKIKYFSNKLFKYLIMNI